MAAKTVHFSKQNGFCCFFFFFTLTAADPPGLEHPISSRSRKTADCDPKKHSDFPYAVWRARRHVCFSGSWLKHSWLSFWAFADREHAGWGGHNLVTAVPKSALRSSLTFPLSKWTRLSRERKAAKCINDDREEVNAQLTGLHHVLISLKKNTSPIFVCFFVV